MSDVKDAVRGRYSRIAAQLLNAEPEVCCGEGCGCGRYDAGEIAAIGLKETVSLGCGNPVLLAELRPGESVLDLGSGGGLDVLLSARRVGPEGHAYGVDMTDEMLALAGRNRSKAGVSNATFLKGSIEALPLPDAAVDVVISNCVINLAEDKGAVLREAFRVLRPGGRLAISDMVEIDELGPDLKQALDAWAGCIAGTVPVASYRALLLQAGFAEPEFDIHATQQMSHGQGRIGSAYIRASKPV